MGTSGTGAELVKKLLCCKKVELVPTQILFVDDEPGIRATLPAILEDNGFKVRVAASVPEALQAIHSQRFDALITDLNVGEPADGFTIVSAMRRTQPHCVNFILTGYPAFETALQAIRCQVDEYLLKPADIHTLLNSLREKLNGHKRQRFIQSQPLAKLLAEHTDAIVEQTLTAMHVHPRLSRLNLSRKQRAGHIRDLVVEIVQSQTTGDKTLSAGVKHAKLRKRQGYTQSMLVDDIRVLGSAIYEFVQSKLLNLQLSTLVPDLSSINDYLDAELQDGLRIFVDERAA